MSNPKTHILTSSSRRKYTVAPSASKTLLSREELRNIERYVTTAGVGGVSPVSRPPTHVSAPASHARAGGTAMTATATTAAPKFTSGTVTGSGTTASHRASSRIPPLPFDRVRPCEDAVLALRVCAVRAREPALDVPLRFAAPEEFHLPDMTDPPARLPVARRVGALMKGGACVSVSWETPYAVGGSGSATASAHRDVAGASGLRDAEARAQSAVRSGDAAQAAFLFSSLGALHYNCGNMEAAVGAFAKSLALFESTGHAQGVAFCHNLCGHCYFRLAEYASALVEYKKLDALGAAYVHCVAQVNMGVCYSALGEHEFALQALTDALASAKEAGVAMLETIALGDLGLASLRSGDMRAAQTHLEGCLEQCSIAGDKGGAAVCLLLLGHVYGIIHDHTHAAFYYEHAYRVGGEAGLPDIVAAARVNYGVARGSAALRETVLAEAAAMGKTNDVASVISALPP